MHSVRLDGIDNQVSDLFSAIQVESLSIPAGVIASDCDILALGEALLANSAQWSARSMAKSLPFQAFETGFVHGLCTEEYLNSKFGLTDWKLIRQAVLIITNLPVLASLTA